MERTFQNVQFERFADDAVIHCVSESQARFVRDAVTRRLVEVGLELHPDKTRIVYCKDSRRRGSYEEISFTFCGYTFRPRKAYNQRTGEVFTGFLPAVSPEKLTAMSRRVGSWPYRSWRSSENERRRSGLRRSAPALLFVVAISIGICPPSRGLGFAD